MKRKQRRRSAYAKNLVFSQRGSYPQWCLCAVRGVGVGWGYEDRFSDYVFHQSFAMALLIIYRSIQLYDYTLNKANNIDLDQTRCLYLFFGVIFPQFLV